MPRGAGTWRERGIHLGPRRASAELAAEGRSSPRVERGLRPSASRAEGDGKLCRRSHFFEAGFVALHNPGCKSKLTGVSQLGRRRQERKRWGEEGAAHPKACAGGGKDPWATRDTSSGGPLPSPTGERGRAAGRIPSSPPATVPAPPPPRR